MPRSLPTVLLILTSMAATSGPETPPTVRKYLVGNAADVVTPTRGHWVLQGGGDDVDMNYIRMGENGGGGDFVVLRASGEAEYNDHIFALCRCDSVETLVFSNREAAFDPVVVATIRNAEALFIAGGDQSNYLRFWKDTPVEDAINHVAAKPAPVGGTSAGMAILGEFVYSAMGVESLSSRVALSDPYASDVTLARGFLALPGLAKVLMDQHLQERDRIGRTVTLLARLVRDGWDADPRAIAADRETALHVDPVTGTAEVFATADHPTPYVYFLRPSEPPERCEPGRPLTFRNVDVYRLGPGGRFNLRGWNGTSGTSYRLSAEEGQLRSTGHSPY
jgi:cyanophycinase-like exopeptidase